MAQYVTSAYVTILLDSNNKDEALEICTQLLQNCTFNTQAGQIKLGYTISNVQNVDDITVNEENKEEGDNK